MPTKLYFEKGHTLTVDEEAGAVEGAFRTVSPNPASLAEFTKKGKTVFVNVSLVRYFQEYSPGRSSSF